MDRARRLSDFWAWLPAFRAVAETEHLPTASKALRVTPSALSRTIRLLEDEIGQPLFDRTGRRITLNAAGELFLTSTRDAMRVVHEGLGAISAGGFVGPVHVSVPGPFAPLYVLPAVEALAVEHPGLVVHLHSMGAATVRGSLRRGEVDVALLDDPLRDDDLTLVRLHPLRHDVFLSAASTASANSEHVFVAPMSDSRGSTPDAWPLDRPRRVGLRVASMQVAIDAVRRGPYAAVLPVPVGEAAGLRALGLASKMGKSALHVMHRPSLKIHGRTEAVVDAIRAALASVPKASAKG